MQQPYGDLQAALAPLMRQLERLDDRMREGATRQDLADLRKELVARESLEPVLSDLRRQIIRAEADRLADKTAFENQLKDMKADRVSRTERLWQRLGPIIGILALMLTLFEFLSHIKFLP